MKNRVPFLKLKAKSLLMGTALGIAAPAAFASHLTGGELTIKHISGNNYEIRVTQYKDASAAPFAPYQQYHILTTNTSGSPAVLFRTDTVMRNMALGRSILANAPFTFEAGVYTDTVQLPPNKYWVATVECCRHASILNISNASTSYTGLVAEMTVPTTSANSGAEFLAPPMPFFARNAPVNYNPLPYDADGDSLVWAPITPLGNVVQQGGIMMSATVMGYVAPPADPANPITINRVSGNLTWTPTGQQGMYAQAFQVDAYRGGVKTSSSIRDYSFVVLPVDTATVPKMQASGNVQFNSTGKYYFINYTPGQPLTFSVTGTAGNVLAPLEMKLFTELSQGTNPPQLVVAPGTGGSVTGTFTWTPGNTFQKTVIAVVRGKNSHIQNDFTIVLKPGSGPVGITPVAEKGNTKLYPNPNKGAFKLEFSGNPGQVEVAVLTSLGQLAAQVHQGVISGNAMLSLDQTLAKGLYFVRIRHAGGETEVLPFVVE